MLLGRISRQRAVAICRRESLNFKQLQEETGLLLQTGAKLYCRRWTTCPAAEWEYYVGGYAYDGSDITPYLKAGGRCPVTQSQEPSNQEKPT